MEEKWTRILHLSDLHRTKVDRKLTVNAALLQHLNTDIQTTYLEDSWKLPVEDRRLGAPDLIVVTGDIVQGHPKSESVVRRQYQEAAEFLGNLAHEWLGDDRRRVMIVPGNHDVFWPYSEEKPATKLDLFAEFYNKFYENVSGVQFLAETPYRVAHFPDLGTTLLGMSSLYGNNHKSKRAGLDPRIKAQALQELSKTGSSKDFRLCAWHHPTAPEDSPKDRDWVEPQELEQLSASGIRVLLHGHIHRPVSFVPEGDRVLVIGAGTHAADAGHRPEGTPLQYNLLAINPSRQQVLLFKRRRLSRGKWQADPIDGPVRAFSFTSSNGVERHPSLYAPPTNAAKKLISLEPKLPPSKSPGSSDFRAQCDEAYKSSEIHEVLHEFFGDDFGLYVLSVAENRPLSAAVRHEGVYLIHRALRQQIEVENDLQNSESKARFGHWLLGTDFANQGQPLGVLLQFSRKNKTWAHYCDLLEFQPGRSLGEHQPLLYVLDVPLGYDKKNGNLEEDLQQSLGSCLGRGNPHWPHFTENMQNLLDGLQASDYMGDKILDSLHIPIWREPRIDMILMLSKGRRIPCDLTRLLLLRQCAEKFHDVLKHLMKPVPQT